MENLDIILLTTVVTILFLVFILASYREMLNMEKEDWKSGKEAGPRAAVLDLLVELLNDRQKGSKE